MVLFIERLSMLLHIMLIVFYKKLFKLIRNFFKKIKKNKLWSLKTILKCIGFFFLCMK